MDDSFIFVEVLQCLSNLKNHVAAQVFAEVRQSYNLMKEFSSGTEFQDDVVVLARFGEADKLDDVWMIELSHNLYFLQDIGSLVQPFELVIPEDIGR